MIQLDEWEVLARTIYGEARGEPFKGQVAVAWTVKNRAARPGWWGRGIVGVCLARKQFSCWNPDDLNYRRVLSASLSDPLYLRALCIAGVVLMGDVSDPTGGATHYYAPADGVPPPRWAKNMAVLRTIGAHVFLREPS